jgi:hypothetical protein
MTTITKEYIDSILSYTPSTGNFIWKITRAKAKKGAIAGYIVNGHRYLKIKDIEKPAARWVWFYFHNTFPSNHLLHINGNKMDDRIENLSVQFVQQPFQNLTQDILKQFVTYNPETGIFTWIAPQKTKGKIRTNFHGITVELGYIVIEISGKGYPAHRLAWLYSYGRWPIN